MPKVVTQTVMAFTDSLTSPVWQRTLSRLFETWSFEMSPLPSYLAMESEYQTDHRLREKNSAPSHRSSRPPKTSSRAKSFNGIHRRKAKRMSW